MQFIFHTFVKVRFNTVFLTFGKMMNNLKRRKTKASTDIILTSDSIITNEEWTPKQGDRVMVFNKIFKDWRVRIFAVKHNGLFFCEAKEAPTVLVSYELIKPLE